MTNREPASSLARLFFQLPATLLLAACVSTNSSQSSETLKPTEGPWPGQYALKTSIKSSDVKIESNLSIITCTGETAGSICSFKYTSGNSIGSCAADGKLTIKTSTLAQFEVIVPGTGDSPRGLCVLAFAKAAHKLGVSAKDIYRAPEDEKFGSTCATLCAAKGGASLDADGLTRVNTRAPVRKPTPPKPTKKSK